MLYKGGIYRKGFVRYSKEAYKNSDYSRPVSYERLYEYCRVDAETLQKDWVAFNETPELFDF